MGFLRGANRWTGQAVNKPVLLDGFCKAGGATKGYQMAGFYVVGVDIEPQPHYCGDEFIQADFFDVPLEGYDAIHVSPPCHDHIRSIGAHKPDGTGWMLAAARERLQAQAAPWVIENVPGAPMRADFKLCGCMFGLPKLKRERWFETSWQGFALLHPCIHLEPVVSVVGHGTPSGTARPYRGGAFAPLARQAMGIDWMNRDELAQAIPPRYTEFIGEQLLAALAVTP